MRRIILLPILFLLFFAAVSRLEAASAGKTAAALKTQSEAETVYKEGLNAYWSRNYASAVSLFSRVSAIDPDYKTRNVQVYQAMAAYRLRGKKPGVIETYVVPLRENLPKNEILISDEQEWLHLVSETQSVLQEANVYVSKVQESEKVPGDQLGEAIYYLKQARLAFDRQQYTDVIRMSNISIEKARALFEQAVEPERKILGSLGDTPVTFNVTDLDMKEALKQIYDLTGVNIVLSGGISGKVTMNVKDVPLRQILDLIVDTNGLKYAEKDNVIRIMTPEEYEKTSEGLTKRNKKVYLLKYGEAKGIAKAIQESMGISSVIPDLRTNSIIADVKTAQQSEDIENLIQQLDTPVNQVLIEAELIEISRTNQKNLGGSTLIRSQLLDTVRVTGPLWGDTSSLSSSLTAAPDANMFFGLTHKNFQTIIKALSAEGVAKVLQSPRVMATSGSSATISATDIFPDVQIQTSTQTNAAGFTTSLVTAYNVVEKPISTSFQITPLIHNNRTISLTIGLMVQRITGTVAIPTPVAGVTRQYPLISTRETAQNILLWDGETLVIGGIITNDSLKSESGTPIIRKIPILKYFFANDTLSTTEKELILLLTPRIVHTFDDAKILTREMQASQQKMEPKRDILDMPWF